MLAGGKGGYGICFPCLVSDLLARGSSLPDKKGGNNMVRRTDTERSRLFRISRRPCQKTPHPNVLVAERRKRLGSIGGGVMRRSLLIPDFPDDSVVSAWRLRLFPGKPSVSDDLLPKRPRNPMGDRPKDPLRVDFDRQIQLAFHGSTVTSDAGLLAYRELDDALRLTCTAATGLHDTRTGQNTLHTLTAVIV